MAGSINRALLVGHVGQDPEVRNLDSERIVVNLSLATTEKWKDKTSGEQKSRTEWHRISIMNQGLAKVAREYVKKGSHLYVSGQLQTRKWTDSEGVERYSTEVVLPSFGGELVMLGSKSGESSEPAAATSDFAE